jgi:hypothetical protein
MNNKRYKDYGQRGICVCGEWLNDSTAFMEWALASGYSDNLTIERINVNAEYCPDNCIWIPMSEQAKNKRTNIVIEFNGKALTLADWAREIGVNHWTLRDRYRRGDRGERLLRGYSNA